MRIDPFSASRIRSKRLFYIILSLQITYTHLSTMSWSKYWGEVVSQARIQNDSTMKSLGDILSGSSVTTELLSPSALWKSITYFSISARSYRRKSVYSLALIELSYVSSSSIFCTVSIAMFMQLTRCEKFLLLQICFMSWLGLGRARLAPSSTGAS